MSFGGTYREIRELIRDTALHTRVARGVVRKAMLTSSGGAVLPHATTVLDAFLLDESTYHWQWLVDLSDYNQIRCHSSTGTTTYFHYSTSVTSGSVDPGDWTPFPITFAPGEPAAGVASVLSTSAFLSGNGVPLRWGVIPEELRRPLRLTLSVNTVVDFGPAVLMRRDFFVLPYFAITLQARKES